MLNKEQKKRLHNLFYQMIYSHIENFEKIENEVFDMIEAFINYNINKTKKNISFNSTKTNEQIVIENLKKNSRFK